MKLMSHLIFLVFFLVKVNGQQNGGLDSSKVISTLYNKVEANIIKTIKNNKKKWFDQTNGEG